MENKSTNPQIKIIDPQIKKEDENWIRDLDNEHERIIKNPTEKDKLKPNTSKALIQKDKVTEQIKKQGKQLIRFYKFTHPGTGKMLYGTLLKGQELSVQLVSWGATYISPDEYYTATDEGYRDYKGRMNEKRVKQLLDIEVVRGNPEFEKAIRTK